MRQARGCLLLLVLKQHLKQLYGFTDAKINQYSPSENVKVYEKAVSRRHAPQFDPKATIAQLHDSDDEHELDERGRRRLVDDYLEFKQLMLKFDPEEEEDEETTPSGAASASVSTGASAGASGSAAAGGASGAGGPAGAT